MALRTLFVRRRTPIPEPLRRANVRALSDAAARLTVQNPPIACDFRHQAALWAHSDTSFAAFDVTAADPLLADHDERPLRWQGLQTPTVVPGVSALGAVAGTL